MYTYSCESHYLFAPPTFYCLEIAHQKQCNFRKTRMRQLFKPLPHNFFKHYLINTWQQEADFSFLPVKLRVFKNLFPDTLAGEYASRTHAQCNWAESTTIFATREIIKQTRKLEKKYLKYYVFFLLHFYAGLYTKQQLHKNCQNSPCQ